MLTLLFRQAALVPLLALGAGLLFPTAAGWAREAIGPAVTVMVFGAVVGRRLAPPDAADRRLIAACVLAVAVAGPLAGWLFARAMHFPPDRALWFLLVSAAPISAGAGTISRSLGLPDRAATLAGLMTMLLCPLTVPLALYLAAGPEALGLDPLRLARNLALAILLPAAAATLLRRAAPGLVARHAMRFSGAGVAAASLLAFARGEALSPALLHDLPAFLGAVLLALAAALLSGAVVGAVARSFGRAEATEGAVAGGLRNLSLLWGSLSERLPPEGELFLTATVVPFYVLPWVAKRVLAKRVLAWRPASLGGALPAAACGKA